MGGRSARPAPRLPRRPGRRGRSRRTPSPRARVQAGQAIAPSEEALAQGRTKRPDFGGAGAPAPKLDLEGSPGASDAHVDGRALRQLQTQLHRAGRRGPEHLADPKQRSCQLGCGRSGPRGLRRRGARRRRRKGRGPQRHQGFLELIVVASTRPKQRRPGRKAAFVRRRQQERRPRAAVAAFGTIGAGARSSCRRVGSRRAAPGRRPKRRCGTRRSDGPVVHAPIVAKAKPGLRAWRSREDPISFGPSARRAAGRSSVFGARRSDVRRPAVCVRPADGRSGSNAPNGLGAPTMTTAWNWQSPPVP